MSYCLHSILRLVQTILSQGDWAGNFFSSHFDDIYLSCAIVCGNTKRSTKKLRTRPKFALFVTEKLVQVSRQELHASPHIEHFPILSYPYISIYGYVLSIYGYVG